MTLKKEENGRDSARSKRVPKNIEEFIADGWLEVIEVYIRRHYNLKDCLNTTEELVNDVLLSLIEKEYIEKYNEESEGAIDFQPYILIFTRNFISSRVKRENNTKNGQAILMANSLQNSLPEDESQMERGVTYVESVQLQEEVDFDFNLLLDDIRKDLKVWKAHSSVEWQGKEISRDPSTVFEFLLNDISVAEIANIFQTSNQFIYNLIKKIRMSETLAFYEVNCGNVRSPHRRRGRRK